MVILVRFKSKLLLSSGRINSLVFPKQKMKHVKRARVYVHGRGNTPPMSNPVRQLWFHASVMHRWISCILLEKSCMQRVRDSILIFSEVFLNSPLFPLQGLNEVTPGVELPPHLMSKARNPLKEQNNLDSLIDQIEEASKMLLYLHQNYLPFFNEIEDVANATHYLSSSDLFSNQLVQKDVFDKCALLTGIRGVMYSNTDVVGNVWRPLTKPEYHAVLQGQRDLKAEVVGPWSLYDATSFYAERLPYIRRLQNRECIIAIRERVKADYINLDSIFRWLR